MRAPLRAVMLLAASLAAAAAFDPRHTLGARGRARGPADAKRSRALPLGARAGAGRVLAARDVLSDVPRWLDGALSAERFTQLPAPRSAPAGTAACWPGASAAAAARHRALAGGVAARRVAAVSRSRALMETEAATVVRINGREEYAAALAPKGEDDFVVIKYFASWCRACKALGPKVEKIARNNPSVRFYELEFEANKELCKEMGIKVLPYIEIFKGGKEGKLESFSCGPSKAVQIQDKLRYHLHGEGQPSGVAVGAAAAQAAGGAEEGEAGESETSEAR